MCLISSVLEGGNKICKKWTSDWGVNWECCCKKWQDHLFFSDNTREVIAEHRSAQLDKLDSTQKSKRLETTYDNYLRLIWNSSHNTYTHLITVYYAQINVYLLWV